MAEMLTNVRESGHPALGPGRWIGIGMDHHQDVRPRDQIIRNVYCHNLALEHGRSKDP